MEDRRGLVPRLAALLLFVLLPPDASSACKYHSEDVFPEAERHYARAVTHEKKGELGKAAAAYERALSLEPDNVCAGNGLARLLLSRDPAEGKDLERALRLSCTRSAGSPTPSSS